MKVSEGAEKLADKIASSEVIFLYRPLGLQQYKSTIPIPVELYTECFADLLNYRLANSNKTVNYQSSITATPIQRVVKVTTNREPMTPLHFYRHVEPAKKKLFLAIDMGDSNRRFLEPALNIIERCSRCAITSDEEFYKSRHFSVIPVKDEAGLIHVLFGATELLKEKLPLTVEIRR